jgi:hypothetical protein
MLTTRDDAATLVSTFVADESGVVTTDWIILTGAIMGGCLSALVAIRGGVEALAFDIDDSLSNAQVVNIGTLGTDGNDNFGGPCGGTPEFPIMDCGVFWTFGIAGSVTGADGNSYFVNGDNVVVGPDGDALPLVMNVLGMVDNGDGSGTIQVETRDAAGRLVDNNGIPL